MKLKRSSRKSTGKSTPAPPTPGGDALPLQVTHKDDKPFRPVSRDETMAAVSLLEKASYSVLEREDKPTSSKPGAAFHHLHPAAGGPAPVWASA
ncbi:DNA topoisomerase I [Klebsiella pneumoniae subsp. ozaenae]|uniref:DNA topoisomerase I n=1 Tax=Klebsiella pneumoniae subsp. ozaenae TaxID=574 RepID=A0A377ZGN3_KLEPO|nr:DNA topoisomerase I [Klebsiella pneumoniae subsp. ozaenae]